MRDTGKKKISNIASPNSFAALGADDDDEEENIRGLNRSRKQKEVCQVVNENNLSVCIILKSHVDVAAVYDTCKKVCSRWKWTYNGSLYSKGSRIILGWNNDLVDVMIMTQTNRVMHVQVNTHVDHKTLFCSFVYSDNYYIDRRALWSNLVGHAILMMNRTWVFLAMEVADVNYTGLHFTWNKKPKGSDGILKKIDRIMGNLQFNDDFPGSFAIFQPYRISNHSLCVLPYFHKIVKSKCVKNRIEMVSDASNILYDGNQVPGAFVNHHNQFLRAEGVTNPLDDHYLFTRVLDNAKVDFMVRGVSNDKVKSVIFSMGDDRASGPDGFTAAFFKKAWDVVGGDITCAIWDLFSKGKLLKELNHTIISFIPKVTTLARINDYRPISCCNVLYKCISKIISNRVKEGLGDIVSINQSAFVSGRRISDNIVLMQKLMRNYHMKRGPLSWFKGKRGLRQGDPLSPYLFTLVMEILTLMLHCRVRNSDEFQYHHLCEQQRIINLCFADDLFLFARGHPSLVAVIMDALEEFKQVSGLVSSIPKSTIFFYNVSNAIKASILNSMPFDEGALPVRGDVSWGWQKLLKIRSTIRPFIWHKINNGKSTSAWFDRWADVCPLKDMLSNRDIARSGFSLEDSVSNLISDGFWRWPLDWLSRFLVMAQLQVPSLLDDMDDVILWRDWDGVLRTFFQKLKTQDRLRQWEVDPSIDLNLLRCPLCDLVPDSHDHLFYKCSFSSQARSKVRCLCGMDDISKGRKAKKTSFPDQIVDVILSMVQLKLVTFKFKKTSTGSRLLLDQWKIPSYCIVHDEST
nr:hypothetical protein [Tanacetum cinerariifolium]